MFSTLMATEMIRMGYTNERQEQTERVYNYLCSYINEWGYSPNRKEIAFDLGLTKHQVDRALVRLRGAGRVREHSTMPTAYTLPPVA